MAPAARTGLRVLAAAALLALAVWCVGLERLRQQWEQVDRAWFCAAVASAALAQWISVLRWQAIARIFGLQARTRPLALAYAQGMTLNVLLPGATLGGDALRSVRLQALGNPLGVSALTVLLDRLSGLWVLCVLSLLTGLAGALWWRAAWSPVLGLARGLLDAAPFLEGWGVQQLLWAYLAGLVLACAIPLLPLPRPPSVPVAGAGWGQRAWWRVCELHALTLSQRIPLARSLWSSLLVQALSAATLWLCARAAGGQVEYWQVQAVAAPVFIAGALPVSYGGFGAREIVALVAFPLVGLPADLGLAASVLYGMVAVVLGLATAPSFALAGTRGANVKGSA